MQMCNRSSQHSVANHLVLTKSNWSSIMHKDSFLSPHKAWNVVRFSSNINKLVGRCAVDPTFIVGGQGRFDLVLCRFYKRFYCMWHKENVRYVSYMNWFIFYLDPMTIYDCIVRGYQQQAEQGRLKVFYTGQAEWRSTNIDTTIKPQQKRRLWS